MDAATAVVCVTASLATVWCLSEAYLRYVYSKEVVIGTVPCDSPRSGHILFYGSSLDACQEMTPSYVRVEGTDHPLSVPLEAVMIIEDSKPPPYDQCLMQESEPPPYVECLPKE
ncbi:hypothetical protein V5799_009572 [Amblyomma americanum]|uniref:Uncharacterized protein n=1 Tax=Amblyomma americanum TaxID=6943 RepID=A0AAQ4FBB9_AMBAM